ncbi:hypothetical protein CAEBREN_24569 [Caenorhabditis brenneri]|uniref:Tetratricopeptide repeat protein 5 OB fold domain-containing protein n=1 Tax=Caenorhabditis brenneri TaxID=135651 RepID=G0NMK3_CAEBE|nr:hypothetical protein CAEBREN_24569 [Caenorhabditis brenneri]
MDFKNELELYKRLYFKNHPSSNKEEESIAVIARAEQYIKDNLPTIACQARAYDTNQKALLLYNAGKLFNVLEEYNECGEEYLSTSVRMNPKNPDAWHELGICVMKRRDVEYAQSCFKVKVVLKSFLFSVFTDCSGNKSHRSYTYFFCKPAQTEMRTKAMELIIEARRLDSSYGPANIAFATGLFYCFFTTAKVELQFLDKVIENYRKALQCEFSRTDPEVHINMATCLKFMERYDEALVSLEQAAEYDARNDLETREKLNSFVNYLTKFSDAVQKKGRMKPKRLMEMVNDLKKSPGADGFRAKIIGNVGHDETIPVALVGVDSSGEVYGITIYNCLSNFGFVIGDTVTIVKPDFREIKNLRIPTDPPTFVESLKWIRVGTPTQIKKNGVPLPESVLARAVASTQAK